MTVSDERVASVLNAEKPDKPDSNPITAMAGDAGEDEKQAWEQWYNDVTLYATRLFYEAGEDNPETVGDVLTTIRTSDERVSSLMGDLHGAMDESCPEVRHELDNLGLSMFQAGSAIQLAAAVYVTVHGDDEEGMDDDG